MPNALVKSLADRTGKSVAEVEEKYKEAKAAARKQYPDLSEDDDKFWAIVTTITKKMIGIKKESFLEILNGDMLILEHTDTKVDKE